jgi:hypothetical protein
MNVFTEERLLFWKLKLLAMAEATQGRLQERNFVTIHGFLVLKRPTLQ